MIALNTNKRTNIGTTLRCGVAFGCNYIIVVGDMNYGTHGAHGSQTRIKVLHFYHWNELKQFAIANNCIIYGIVDSDFELPLPYCTVTSIEFPRDRTAIFISPTKSGKLRQDQIDVCDAFLAVPFCGGLQFARHVHPDVKLSICLHEYAISQNLEAGLFVGEKFILTDTKPQSERFESKSLPILENCTNNLPSDIPEVNLADFSLFHNGSDY